MAEGGIKFLNPQKHAEPYNCQEMDIEKLI